MKNKLTRLLKIYEAWIAGEQDKKRIKEIKAHIQLIKEILLKHENDNKKPVKKQRLQKEVRSGRKKATSKK